MTLYSKKSGVIATLESLDGNMLNGAGYKHCANSEQYNKLYFSICGVWAKSIKLRQAMLGTRNIVMRLILGGEQRLIIRLLLIIVTPR